MKNVFLLPTDKPSRLVIDTIENKLYYQPILHNKTVNVLTQNIYITSDEEIKKDEFYLGDDNHIYNLCTTVNSNGKKIILTTNEELIEEGIQAIDDEFLNWFVNNPSCEVIKVNKLCYGALSGFADAGYKIIIPQEEPKQETLEEVAERLIFETIGGNYGITSSDEHDQVDGYYNTYEEAYLTLKLKWQQEILEEVDEKIKNLYYTKQVMNPYPVEDYSHTAYEKGFIEGYQESVKWEKEQGKNKFSDALEFGRWIIQNPNFQNDSSWSLETAKFNFEQFKKK